MYDSFECWNCGLTVYVEGDGDICTYKPIGSVVSYDVCEPCWNDLMEARDEDG